MAVSQATLIATVRPGERRSTLVSRPLLYLDLDEQLNPCDAKRGCRPEGYTTHRIKPGSWLTHLGARP